MDKQTPLTFEGIKKVCCYAGCVCSICVLTIFAEQMAGYDSALLRGVCSLGAVVSAFVCLAFAVIGAVKRKEP